MNRSSRLTATKLRYGWLGLLTPLIGIILLMVGCNSAADSTPALIEAGQAGSGASSTAPISPTMTLMPSVTTTAPITGQRRITATLRTHTALNIRTGPGLDYPVIGTFAENANSLILARSVDNGWWKIDCPDELNREECWVTADSQYVSAQNAYAVSIATAQPPPSPTPEPTATPCVGSAPAGWVLYTVSPGDTWSELAQRGGATVESMQLANCLAVLLAGAIIYVPAAVAYTGGPAIAPPPVDRAPSEPLIPLSALPAVLGFGSPNAYTSCSCKRLPPGDSPMMIIGDQPANEGEGQEWEVGATIPICGQGFTPSAPVQIQLRPPSGASQTMVAQSDLAGEWRTSWVAPPTAALNQEYHIIARQAELQREGRVQITPSERPKIELQPHEVALGDAVTASLREFSSGFNVGLYRQVEFTVTIPGTDIIGTEVEWRLVRPAGVLPRVDRNGWGEFRIQTGDLERAVSYVVWGSGMIEAFFTDCQVFTVR